MNIRRILLIGVPLLIFAFAGLYIFLGGLKQPEIRITDSQGYIILGKRYAGSVEDKKLKETYRDVQQKQKDEVLKGAFSVIHNFEPDEKKGVIDVVIGIIVKDSVQKAPEGYKYFTWNKKTVAETVIRSHFSVAPAPEEVKQVVEEMAKLKGYRIGQGSLERYYATDHLVVEVPLIKK